MKLLRLRPGRQVFLSQSVTQEGLPQRTLWSEVPIEDVEEGLANVSLKRDGTGTNLDSGTTELP